jgi:hypothetical protein
LEYIINLKNNFCRIFDINLVNGRPSVSDGSGTPQPEERGARSIANSAGVLPAAAGARNAPNIIKFMKYGNWV